MGAVVRIGLYVSAADGPDPETLVARFQRAEAQGFHTAWVGQVLDHEALTLLALAARATRRIELGTWVVPIQPRHPVTLAQQALTLQWTSGGRLVLGLGVSHEAVVARRLGLDYAHPLRQARELLDVLPPLLRGDEVEHAGEHYRLAVRVGTLGAPPPPLLLAALGPRMLSLAGERADGAALWLVGPRSLETAVLPRLREAAAAAGRPPPRVACGLPVAVTHSKDAAKSVEAFLARSAALPAYRRALAREGVASPADVALLGDESLVARRIEALAALGVSDFNAVLVPVEGDADAPRRSRELLAQLHASSGARKMNR